MNIKRLVKNWHIPVLGLVLLVGWDWVANHRPVPSPSDVQDSDGVGVIMQAYQEQRSKLWVVVDGAVKRELADDNKGSRHQRFLLRLENGHTLLVAHNIDLAKRVPLSKGDGLTIRGRYEWNKKGGVLHWTHHDPKGHIAGGWIEHKQKRYK